MSILSAADSPSARDHFPFRPLIAFTGAVLVFIGLRITPGPLVQSDAPTANYVAQCERLGEVVIDKPGVNGIDVRSDEWRGEQESAVQACMRDIALR